ncbi:hypothetical protein [Amycolatopsis pigmentata]|uniref:Uncharacterized protein n=1 Tax=Amycolatopsis pigmentata TaxID=450801 RepID=A0ABW5G800_9PSEU
MVREFARARDRVDRALLGSARHLVPVGALPPRAWNEVARSGVVVTAAA